MSDWKEPLSAITGARHGGQVGSSLEPLRALDARFPNVAEINYQLAWTCDTLGRTAEAVPYYEKAIALGLPPHELSGALLGLGAACRSLGQSARAADVLQSGRAQFPDNREFDVFLALALYDLGRHAESIKLLLTVIADTADDPGLTAYQRAIRHHASRL